MIEEMFAIARSLSKTRWSDLRERVRSVGDVNYALATSGLSEFERARIFSAFNRFYNDVESFVADLSYAYDVLASIKPPELAWTGPRVRGVDGIRRTFSVARAIVAAAQHRLIVAGYVAKSDILDRLGILARAKSGVRVTLMTDKVDFEDASVRAIVAAGVQIIAASPSLERDMSKFHVKALVADDHTALVTSANFTHLGHTENIELGVIIRGQEAATIGALLDGYAQTLEFMAKSG